MTIPKIKEWIKDLRSGKYEQCNGTLRIGTEGKYSYCCLGVLNVVLGNDFTEYGRLKGYEGDLVPEHFYDNNFTKRVELQAWQRNDRDGQTFEEIADWLEKTLLR